MKKLLLLSAALVGCSSGTLESPDAVGIDAPAADARVGPDAGADATATGMDAELGPELAPGQDAQAMDVAVGPDASPPVDGGGCGFNEAERLDGIWVGRLTANTVFDPTSSSSVTIPLRPEAGDFVAAGVVRLAQDRGVVWSAQITLGTMFDNLRFTEHSRPDPVDGSIYVLAVAQPNNAAYLRFYHSNGMLAHEFLPGGTGPDNITGRQRTTNHFLVKYDSTGMVLWVRRFGLNTTGDAQDGVTSFDLSGGRLRVHGYAGGAAQVFGIGEPDELTVNHTGGYLYWADFDAGDGHYLAGTARFFRTTGATGGAGVGVPGLTGHHARNSAGELAMVGQASGPSLEVGAGGPGAVTLSSTKSMAVFARIGADGAPIFVRTATIVANSGAALDPDSAGLGESGWLVAGGRVGATGDHQFAGGPRVTLQDNAGFVVAYRPDGSFAWVRQILGNSPYPANSILVDEAEGAVYVSGSGNTNSVLGPGEPNELRIRDPIGWYLARYALDTGDLQWVRVLGSIGTGYAAFPLGNQIVVPAQGLRVTVWGGPVEVSDQGSVGAQVLFRFDPQGSLLSCRAVVNSNNLVVPD